MLVSTSLSGNRNRYLVPGVPNFVPLCSTLLLSSQIDGSRMFVGDETYYNNESFLYCGKPFSVIQRMYIDQTKK